MSYQVLARKYRPATFQELEGQQHVLQALVNALENSRLHHAYLFTGTRGVGKTTIARILAKCLNCEAGVTATPCGTCGACSEIAEGRSVDLIEVDAASRTGVDDMRELLDNVQYMPTASRFKVYLIDEVHMLSKSSFNAMLKTLEEPPEHVKFLFATTDPKKLPVTVLSRCLQFNLKNLTPEQIVKYLGKVLDAESVKHEDTALWQLGRAADGSMRDALSLTDQAISFGDNAVMEKEVREMLGAIDQREVFRLLEAVADEDGAAILDKVRQLSEFSPDYAGMLDDLLSILHRLAIAKAVPGALDNSQGDKELVEGLAGKFGPEHIQLLYQIGLVGQRDLQYAPSMRTGFEMVLLRMLSFTLDSLQGGEGSEGGRPPAASRAAGGKPAPANRRATAAEKPVEKLAEPPPAEAVQQPRPSQPSKPGAVASDTKKASAPPVSVPLAPEHWPEIVEALDVGSVTRALAANCTLKSVAGDACELVLDESHASLWNKSREGQIAEALSGNYGRTISVNLEMGLSADDTPAKVKARNRRETRAKAVEVMENDTNVQRLIQRFDGKLDRGSVAPLPKELSRPDPGQDPRQDPKQEPKQGPA